MTKEELSEIIAAVKRQVEWNGWEEPYVSQVAQSALRRVLRARKRRSKQSLAKIESLERSRDEDRGWI